MMVMEISSTKNKNKKSSGASSRCSRESSWTPLLYAIQSPKHQKSENGKDKRDTAPINRQSG